MATHRSSVVFLLLLLSPSCFFVLSVGGYNTGIVDQLHEPYCHEWSGEPEACTLYVGLSAGTKLFIPGDVTYEWLVGEVSSLVNSAGLVDVPPECERMAAAMGCRTYFRPCIVDPQTNETLVAPQQPCKEMCFEYGEACADFWSSFGVPLGFGLFFPNGSSQIPLDCDERDPFTQDRSSPFYEASFFNVSSANSTNGIATASCLGKELKSDQFFTGCVEPLVPAGDNRCGFECPLPSLEEDQYDAVKIMQTVLGWISWVSSLLLILTYSIDKKLRKWPSNLILMVSISAHIAAGAIILPSMAGYENVWCGVDGSVAAPDITYYRYDPETGSADIEMNNDGLIFKSELCSFQGFLLLFGFLAGTMWWALIAFNMFLQINFSEKIPTTKRFRVGQQIIFHVIGWGIPLLLAIIPSAADRIGFSSAATFCFLTNEDDAAYLIALWFVPVSLLLFPSLVFFLCSIGRILFVGVKYNKLKQLLVSNYRIAVFVGVFLLVYTCIFAYTIQVEANEDNIQEGYNKYYRCLTYEYTVKKCELSEDVSSYPLVILRGFGFSGLGLFLLLTFMSWEWRVIYRKLWKRTRSRLSSYTTSSNKSSSTSSSSKGIEMEENSA
ncbi:hypothetical protein QOT17_018718 [Balamuthia mandrillaris]